MSEPDSPAPTPASPTEPKTGGASLEESVVEVLRTIFDPEIPVNIYELGLIYDVSFQEDNDVKIKMTLTSPACPVAGSLPGDVQTRVQAIPGIGNVDVDLVWDPAWNPEMMTEAAKLELGML